MTICGQIPTDRPTRFEGLSFAHYGGADWRFCEDGDPWHSIGPIYKSKAELMADMFRYAQVYCSGRGR